MNKEEAKQELHNLAFPKLYTIPEKLNISDVLRIVDGIDEPQKPKVPQVAVEFYECYKDRCLDLGDWFSDFYSKEAIEDFPRVEKLAEWLHDNDNETNRQREYALATLITFGPDSVEVEKGPLGVLLVDMPKNALWKYTYLAYRKSDARTYVYRADAVKDVMDDGLKVTEAEAKEKYPNFKWVSLEELGNEQI